MIQCVVGEPGSGKSFFAVKYLCKFVEFDDLYQEYVLKKDVLIITNIEGLQIKHWKFPDCMGDQTIEQFFTIKNFEGIQRKTGKAHIILVFDEAHEIFPSGYKNMDIYNFFAYHRHIGLDVFFLTQGIESLSRMFLPLYEFIVKAEPRSKKVIGFRYKFLTKSGQFLYMKTLKEEKNVFRAYQSMRVDEMNKPKNVMVMYAGAVVLLFALAGGLFYTGITDIKSKGAETAQADTPEKKEPAKITLVNPHESEKQKFEKQIRAEYEQWETVKIDGYLEDESGKIWIVLDGLRLVYDQRFRNLQKDYLTIDRKKIATAEQRAGA